MRSSPAVAAFNNDVMSLVCCIRCRTGQKHRGSFSSELLQHRRGREGRNWVPRAGTVRCCGCCKSQVLWSVGL